MKQHGGASMAALQRALREKTREAEILHKISDTVSGNLDLDAVMHDIVDIAVEGTKADSCLIYLLNSHRDELVLRASKNPHPKLIGHIRLSLGEGITGWVAQQGRAVAIASNASDDPRFKFFHNLPEDRHQAFLSVPLMAKREVIGVIKDRKSTRLISSHSQISYAVFCLKKKNKVIRLQLASILISAFGDTAHNLVLYR